MMAATSAAPSAGTRVLALLRVSDLDKLCERTKNLSITQSVDFVLPAVSTLAAAPDADAAGGDLQAAVGVALHQCLVQQRLAGGSMDAAIERAMAGEHRRPRELEPGIPKALEAVIVRTLRERPEERFASMRELGAALLPFASTSVQEAQAAGLGAAGAPDQDAPEASTTDGAEASKPTRRPGDLKLLAAFAAVLLPVVLALGGARDKDPKPTSPSAPAQETARAQESASASAPAPAEDTAREQAAPKEPAQTPPEPAAQPATRAQAAAPDAARAYAVDVTVDPTTAWIMLDGKFAGSGTLRRTLPRDGELHELHVGAPGYRVRALRFNNTPPPKLVVLEAAARRAR